MATGGFAQPWLDFEKEIGVRPCLPGGTLENVISSYNDFGMILVSKLTFPSPDTSVQTEDKEISPGLIVRTYTPPDYETKKPVIVFYHGGGWSMGDLTGEDGLCRSVAKGAGMVVVSVDYRLAPQSAFPKPLEDCVLAYHWAVANFEYLKTSSGEAIVFGTSAGANLAIATALKLVDSGMTEALKGIVAVVPVTVHPDAVPDELKSKYTSYVEHATNTVNSSEAMRVFLDGYGAPPTSPYVSVLLHKDLRKLPKTYIMAASHDTLRDDARLFKEALDNAGVSNKYDEFKGYPHFWWSFPSKHLAEPKKEYDAKLLAGIEFVLSES